MPELSPLEPDEFRKPVETTVLVNSDAVPVYLDSGTGSFCVPGSVLHAAQLSGELTENVEEVNYKLSESKQTAKLQDIDVFQDLKDRLTLMPRVAVFNAWKFSTKEEDAPPLRGDWRSDWRSD